ncbi:MAG: flippase-like domain-containing protein [Betaproteobacteria bacterium]|nr:flippase-like domain-containing protein [Betaproteobacteria bacterium]
MSIGKSLLLLVKVGLLAGLILLALATQDVKQIWELVSEVDLRYLPIFILLNLGTVALASSNLYILLRPLGQKLPWKRLFYFDLLSLAGSYYTPGGVGGVATVMYLISREGAGLKDAAVAVFMDKGITLVIALLSLCTYFVFFAHTRADIEWQLIGVIAIFLAGFSLAVFMSGWLRERLLKIIDRMRCYSGHAPVLGMNLAVTLGIFGLSALQYLVAFQALGLRVEEPLLIFISYGVLIIINYLPIAFGGIGLGEVSALFLWSEMGLTSEQILAALLIVRLFTLLATILLVGGALLARLRH